MVHDDLRVEWIRQRVSAGFVLPDCPNCFDELLSLKDGEQEQKIIQYLNVVSDEDSPSCLLFFKTIREEEIEVEVPVESPERQRERDSSDPNLKPLSHIRAEIISGPEQTNEDSPSFRIETQVVYHTELHVAVNQYPEKFLKSRLFYFIRNTKEEIMLHIPELDLGPDGNVLLSNPEMLEELEQCVMNWQTHLTVVLEEQRNKKPQNLATGANFGVIMETIPALMESLQIVWLISCHYNNNERMVSLMERVAWQLCERVSQVIDIHTLFKDNRASAKSKVRDAKQVLDLWKSSYFAVRAEIEESGREARWEFDRRRLFEKTDYMLLSARTCTMQCRLWRSSIISLAQS
ncbi:hypothetical protein INR49_006246 [Caranx melampygus]|nr:hypothetical protein INR49_006246 [Caranx melampygus]